VITTCPDRPETIRIILFDLGGVLVEWNGTEELSTLAGLDFSREDAARFWLHSPAVRKFESGLCNPEEFGRQAVAELQLGITPDEWLSLFVSWDRGPLPGAVELLTELSATHELGCLSNNNQLHWSRICEKHEFGRFFRRQYLSHEIGLCKPDPRIFEFVLDDLGLPPGTVFYLDDSPEIVKSALELGIQAVRAKGVEEVRGVLTREGLL